MKKLISIVILFSSYAFSQGYDFQQLCLDCAAQNGFYCGDDPANWTSYSPNGCVPNGEGGLMYLNDGWDDCVNGADEDDAVPTSPDECAPPAEECDTVYVDVPVYIYETIFQTDTIYQTEYITQIVIDTVVEIETVFEEIFITDTLWMEGALDTMYIDVIEYIEIIVEEYIDCETGLPCNTGMQEILDKSLNTGLIYNLQGQAI